ncbi:MAG TPA: alpha-E domain-containing protein [Oscillatoriaceae cyanobacterium]
MLSRTAEAFFWIGRYVERAEYAARTAMVHRHLLVENPDPAFEVETWTRLLQQSGDLVLFRSRYGALTPPDALEFWTLDAENPNSMVACMAAARENARTVQDQLSSEVWFQINRFFHALKGIGRQAFWESPHDVLREIRDAGYTLAGVIDSTMLHDERLAFYRMGRDIERAGWTVRLLRAPALTDSGEPVALDAFTQCLAVLKSASAYEAYRKETRAGLDPSAIAGFLLLSERFPRSVRYCARSLERSLALVVPPGGNSAPERAIGQFAADMAFAAMPDIDGEGLASYLDGLAERLDGISDAIARTYFRYADAPSQPAAGLPQRRKAFPAPALPVTPLQAIVRVVHEFTYTYEAPIRDVRTILRLVPPSRYGRQRVLDVSWHLAPQGDERQQLDAFGNQVWQLEHAEVHGTLSGRVEMLVENIAVHHAEGALALGGVALMDEEGIAGPAEYTAATALTEASEGMRAIARRLQDENRQSTRLAEAILRAVHAQFRYEAGVTHVGTTAVEAFALGRGVCQDYAHVMLAICRAAGMSARYVSGYLPAEGLMHAWVEVLVADPASGRDLWVAYDPTNARRVDETYVTVALGRDYADVTPMSGVYTGTAKNHLTARVIAKVESRGPLPPSRGTGQLSLAAFELKAGQEPQQ